MKKIMLLVLMATTLSVYAQPFDSTTKDGYFNRLDAQVIPYEKVREADLMWSKRLYKVVDMREKMNHYLYFPTEPANGLSSLFTVIRLNLEEGAVMAYSSLTDDLSLPITNDQALEMGVEKEEFLVEDEFGKIDNKSISNPVSSDQIIRYRIIEDWYFNKATSRLMMQIHAICPVKEVYDDEGEYKGELPLFWIYFPELRNSLVKQSAYSKNIAQRRSLDHMLVNQKYAAFIYKESNVYNRKISSYMQGIDALLEGERIKKEVQDFEQDLWEY